MKESDTYHNINHNEIISTVSALGYTVIFDRC